MCLMKQIFELSKATWDLLVRSAVQIIQFVHRHRQTRNDTQYMHVVRKACSKWKKCAGASKCGALQSAAVLQLL
jgi:hypothetical protein